jgi:hypothetical protein
MLDERGLWQLRLRAVGERFQRPQAFGDFIVA